ncbi:hypothetical protein E6H17_06340 [Candidatus Bathyarchaeota archaeon]|nr:MAG: hypothetical protein E6H17_06340 [Candidatus Bathyarchaeota archaeon]
MSGYSSKDPKEHQAEENSILRITGNLLVRLGASNRLPRGVVWFPKNLDPDKPTLFLGRLRLREALRGKLTEEEWTALLASSLLLNTRMRKKLLLVNWTAIILSFLGFGLFVWFLLPAIGSHLPPNLSHSPWAGGVIVFPLLGFFFLFTRVTGPMRKSLRFRADETVASELGMGAELLRTLRKIDGMSLDSDRHPSRFGRPSISQRIARLSRFVDKVQQGKSESAQHVHDHAQEK